MTVKIETTKKDIKEGLKCEPNKCPIALAALRTFAGCKVTIGTSYMYVHKKHFVVYAERLPQVAIDFIKAFDLSRNVEPISFEVKLPKECERLLC